MRAGQRAVATLSNIRIITGFLGFPAGLSQHYGQTQRRPN